MLEHPEVEVLEGHREAPRRVIGADRSAHLDVVPPIVRAEPERDVDLEPLSLLRRCEQRLVKVGLADEPRQRGPGLDRRLPGRLIRVGGLVLRLGSHSREGQDCQE